LVLTKNAFDCRGNALQGQTLEELVADTKEAAGSKDSQNFVV